MADTQNSAEVEVPGYNDVAQNQIPVREIRVPFSLEEFNKSKPSLRVLVDHEVIVRYAWYLEPPEFIVHVAKPDGADVQAS
ncbi:hypothetical protein KCV07_g5928, partial [Aureobasidium melanogenum]